MDLIKTKAVKMHHFKHRNTAFAKQNVKLAEMSLKNIVEQQKQFFETEKQ